MLNKRVLKEMVEFGRPYLHSWDIDPVYPVMKAVQDARRLPPMRRHWLTAMYWVWYDMGSAERVFGAYPEPGVKLLGVPVLPTGTERRGMRGEVGKDRALQTLNHLVSTMWLRRNYDTMYDGKIVSDPKERWALIYKSVLTVPNCGPWAAYKWCDLCKNVLGYEITAPDIGVGGQGKNAGPVPGMVQLTGLDWRRCAKDTALQEQLLNVIRAEGLPLDGLEEMETLFCDYNSMTHGRYYVGHDIDVQHEQFIRGDVPEEYWEARREVFPRSFLAEYNLWDGPRKDLNKYYVNTGKIFPGGRY